MGATPDRPDVPWEQTDWIVVGRRDFDEGYLGQSAEHPAIAHITQEDFLDYVLFGVREVVPEDQPDDDHPGLAFLSTIPAPSVNQESGGSLDGRPDWNPESELRKLGSTVRRGTSPKRRKAALGVAVNSLGLDRVIGHLEWLVKLHGGNDFMARAVACWRHDLDWLSEEYSQ